jgi:hypothetical protein
MTEQNNLETALICKISINVMVNLIFNFRVCIQHSTCKFYDTFLSNAALMFLQAKCEVQQKSF